MPLRTTCARFAGVLTLCAAAGTARSQAAHADSLVVNTAWLAQHLHDPSLVVLAVDRTDSAYRAGHVPGARFVPFGALAESENGLSLELPPPDSLRLLLESAGVSNATHVVLSGPTLMVTRAFFTLEYLGLRHVSALNGGFTKWKSEGRAIESAAPTFARGRITQPIRPGVVARAPWLLDRLGKPGYSLVDARGDSDYLGASTRGGVPHPGHLQGARHFDWQDAFTSTSDFSVKSLDALGTLWNERVTPGDTVIAYCYIGLRASGTYFVSRLLGYPVRLYDGSFEEWAKLGYPTVTTPTPLRSP